MKGTTLIFVLRTIFFILFLCVVYLPAFSQPGLQELGDATREVKRSYQALVYCCYGVGAITGIIGGVRIYTNWNTGKHHIDAEVIGWFLSCIFFQLMAAFIGSLYGV